MKFDNIEDRMLYYRSLTDFKLLPNSYLMLMLDGRGFSNKVKKQFQLPFDDDFINIMNNTAITLCKSIQGAKFAYVQSDEISIIVTDFDTPNSDAFFDYRFNKIHSITAGIASAYFTKQMMCRLCNTPCSPEDLQQILNDSPLYEFDCKAFVLPTYNDVYAWFGYRQSDCIRNSKQGAAQAQCSYNELVRRNTDEQIQILKDKTGIDWNTDYDNGKKYGRFIYKETEHFISEQYGEYDRTVWKAHNAFPLLDHTGEGRINFDELQKIPIR